MKGKKLVLLFIAVFALGIFAGGIVAYGENTDVLVQKEDAKEEPPKTPEEMTDEELGKYVEEMADKENKDKDKDSEKDNDRDKESNKDDGNAPQATAVVRETESRNVNVRSGASTGHSVVAKIHSGDEVTIVGQEDDWYEVKLEDGTKGWMAGFLLEVDWGIDNV